MAGSGRRGGGGECERRGPSVSRRVFAPAVLLLVVVLVCRGTCEAAPAGKSEAVSVELPQGVDVMIANETQVESKDATGSDVRQWFASPSLVRAGGVLAAFAEGRIEKTQRFDFSDIVARYMNAPEDLSSLAAEVNKGPRKAYTVFSRNKTDRLGVALRPTTIVKDDKVFLLVGSHVLAHNAGDNNNPWTRQESDIQLLVGEPTAGSQGELIRWGEPRSLLRAIAAETQGHGLTRLFGGGGSGIVMANGTLVFPLTARKTTFDFVSLIIYSTDNGTNWAFLGGTTPLGCISPLITEWAEGQLLMVSSCLDGQKVFESRDMGRTWAEAAGALPSVWVRSQPTSAWDELLRVESLIPATTERRAMLYTQRRRLPGETEANALHLWVTDNSRTFRVGALSVEKGSSMTYDSTLLYSHDVLYLLQQRSNKTVSSLFLAPLTEQLKTVKSVLQTWALLDASFSQLSVPTEGLVGFLSNAASGHTWFDGYLCVNATVTNATKVKNGFKFAGPGSGAVWPVNSREDNDQHGFLSHGFTLVATVMIHQAPSGSTPLLGASPGDGTAIVGLSYTHEKKWETVFDGTKAAQSSTWEPGKEYQVALVLQGRKGSVYVNGQLVGSSAKMPALEAREREVAHFYFGDDGKGGGGHATVKNVFLYSRPLSVGELKKVGQSDGSVRGCVPRVLLLLLLGLWGIAALC